VPTSRAHIQPSTSLVFRPARAAVRRRAAPTHPGKPLCRLPYRPVPRRLPPAPPRARPQLAPPFQAVRGSCEGAKIPGPERGADNALCFVRAFAEFNQQRFDAFDFLGGLGPWRARPNLVRFVERLIWLRGQYAILRRNRGSAPPPHQLNLQSWVEAASRSSGPVH
jgi:hypothetical protein